MQPSIDILNELRELSPLLAGMEKTNVFTVPQGYFEGLADHMLIICRGEAPSIVNDLSKKQQQELPAGYFDNLADAIMAKIKAGENETAADELRALSPALYSIQNENVFEVPNGYFTELADDILSKVKPAKVVMMPKRTYSFMKYAVAAAFTGMMALGVFKFTGTQSSTSQALPDYVVDGLKPHNVDEELANVSDGDIQKYLESSGTDVKTALVASSIDDNELPSQEDYLLDDKALDKYLNSINVNDLKN